MLAKVRPLFVAEASKLGLGVMDEQAGEAFLPDGVRLGGDPGQRAEAPVRSSAPTGRELHARAFERLLPILTPFGFQGRKTDLSFKRVFSGGWQQMEFVVEDRSPVYSEFSLLTTLRLQPMAELYAKTFPAVAHMKDRPS
jgi:hypothetical protein